MKTRRRPVLELLGVFVLIAILAASGWRMGSARLDWRTVTVEGFSAGVKLPELESRLGKPAMEGARAVWSNEGVCPVSFWRAEDGFHLSGTRLLWNGQVVASGWPDLSARLNMTPGRHGSSTGEIRGLLGAGETLWGVNDGYHEIYESSRFESAIRYAGKDADHSLLVELPRWPRPARGFAGDFQLIWGRPDPNGPVIGGFSPGKAGYTTYPDGSAREFCCRDLNLQGQQILPWEATEQQVEQALGKATLIDRENGIWGYWGRERFPGEMGILITFLPYRIEVSRDWRPLAEKLRKREEQNHLH